MTRFLFATEKREYNYILDVYCTGEGSVYCTGVGSVYCTGVDSVLYRCG